MKRETEPREGRGVSLIEIMVVLCVFAIMTALLVLNLHSPQASATTSGMAQVVAQELQGARMRAISCQHPVAVVFPSSSGAEPHSQSLYLMEGWPTATVVQVHNYKGDFPAGYIFVGTWASSDTIGYAPSQTPAVNISTWLNPATKDYVVAFAPDGSVVTNDLPWFNGELRILVCSGFAGAPGTGSVSNGTAVAGASQAVLWSLPSPVYKPQTVCVSPQGSVTICPGVKGATSDVVAAAGTAVPVATPAAPPALTGQTGYGINIWSATVEPQPVSGSWGNVTQIKSNGFITIVIRASDTNPGAQLSCALNCSSLPAANSLDGNYTGPAGQFSELPGGSQMRFDPNDCNATAGYPNGCWKSVWIWAPSPRFSYVYNQNTPETGPAYCPQNGQDIHVNCVVSDDHGQSSSTYADGSTGVDVSFTVLNVGHVYFTAEYNGARRLFSMTSGGNSPMLLTDGAWTSDVTCPQVSPDGTTITFCYNNNIYTIPAKSSGSPLLTCVVNGTTLGGTSVTAPCWSPDGTKIAFSANMSGTQQILVTAATSGGSPVAVVNGTQPNWSLGSSNGASNITYLDTGNNITYFNSTTNVWTPGAIAKATNVVSSVGQYPSWTLDGQIVYVTGSGLNCNLIETNITAPVPGTTTLMANTQIAGPVSFSPDNKQAVMASGIYGSFAGFIPTLPQMPSANNTPFQINDSITDVNYVSWGSQ